MLTGHHGFKAHHFADQKVGSAIATGAGAGAARATAPIKLTRTTLSFIVIERLDVVIDRGDEEDSGETGNEHVSLPAIREVYIHLLDCLYAFMTGLELTILPTSIAITDVVLLAYMIVHAQPRTREH